MSLIGTCLSFVAYVLLDYVLIDPGLYLKYDRYTMKVVSFMKTITIFAALLMTVPLVGKPIYNLIKANVASNQASPRLTSVLRVQGNKIVDGKNNEVYLRGFQGLGFYPIPETVYFNAVEQKKLNPQQLDIIASDLNTYTITDFDIQEIKSTGANTVRLWMQLHEIQHTPYTYSEESLQLLEDTINKFGKNGIHVVLVLAGLGSNEYPAEVYFKNKGVELFNPQTDTKNQAVALWGVIAKRFKNNSYVAGYDVVNEPQPPTKEALHNLYTALISEIRKYDQNHIIILPVAEKNEEEFQLGGNYADNNIVATFHFYYPPQFTLDQLYEANPGLKYPGNIGNQYWDKKLLATIFDKAVNLPELKGKPIYVGEFGAHGMRDDSGGLQWVEDVLSLMNERGLHYTMHNYKHRNFHGYWIMKPEAAKALQTALQKLQSGELKYSDLTPEQKQLLTTEKSYYQRAGIESLLEKYFTARN